MAASARCGSPCCSTACSPRELQPFNASSLPSSSRRLGAGLGSSRLPARYHRRQQLQQQQQLLPVKQRLAGRLGTPVCAVSSTDTFTAPSAAAAAGGPSPAQQQFAQQQQQLLQRKAAPEAVRSTGTAPRRPVGPPTATLTRILLSGQPQHVLRTLTSRRLPSVSGPVSLLLFLVTLVAATLAALRLAIVNKVKSCKTCRGFGIVRCRLCNGAGRVDWTAKLSHFDCCPLCMNKRFTECNECGGYYHRPLFSHGRWVELPYRQQVFMLVLPRCRRGSTA